MDSLRGGTRRFGSGWTRSSAPLPPHAPHATALIVAALTLLVAVSPGNAQDSAATGGPLELQGAFQDMAVSLEASNAQVNLILDAAATGPWYYVEDPTGRTSDCTPLAGGLRCFGPEGSATQLRIDVVLPPGGSARVRGSQLDLALGPLEDDSESRGPGGEDREKGEGEEEDELDDLDRRHASMGTPFGPLSLTVASSQVYWSGSVGGSIVADSSSILLDQVRGGFELDLTGTDLQATGVTGNLQTQATDSTLELRRTQGAVSGRTSGTSWVVEVHQGQTTLELAGGSFQSNDSNGKVELTGEGASVRIEGGLLRGGWSVEGEQMVVSAISVGGEGTLTLEGGSFDGERLEGLKADLNSVNLSLRGSGKNVTVTARSGSDATLSDVAGRVDATVQDSSLTLNSVSDLKLSAKGATIRATGLSRTGNWTIRDSIVDFDLTGVQGNAMLKLDGASEAQVTLPSPCFVAYQGRTTPLSQGLEVSGCEVRSSAQRRRGGARALARLDGGRGVVLRVDLDPRATARISGRD